MATEGYVKFEYFSKGVPPYYNTGGFPELLDDEKITIETPSIDMSYHQYVSLFKKFWIVRDVAFAIFLAEFKNFDFQIFLFTLPNSA
jgi:hypothetical protein